jgi:hypothetical protein
MTLVAVLVAVVLVVRGAPVIICVKRAHDLTYSVHVVRHTAEALASRLQLKVHEDLAVVGQVCSAQGVGIAP